MDNPSLAKFREDWKAELGLTTNDNVNKAIDSWLQAQGVDLFAFFSNLLELIKKQWSALEKIFKFLKSQNSKFLNFSISLLGLFWVD